MISRKIKIISSLLFSLLFLLLSFTACSKNDENIVVPKREPVQKKEVKKVIKKNPKDLLKAMKIDRSKAPFAGIWEPSTSGYGFLLLFPDGNFELYGKFDKGCKREPKKKGTYKVTGERNIDFTVNGKTENKKLDIFSGFVEIKGYGLFFLPVGVKLKEEKKEYSDPKKLIQFCRNVNMGSISKIYPYLSHYSKLQLMKIGILNKNSLAAHEKYTRGIRSFLRNYKKINSIESIKKSGDKEIFKLILKDMEGKVYSETMSVVKEGGKLRCGFFDNMKLSSTNASQKELSFWYEEIANNTKVHVFASDNLKVKVKFEKKNISIQKFKNETELLYELNGKFKIVANTPNVIALSVKKVITKKDKKEKKVDDTPKNVIIAFKFKENIVSIILDDKDYPMSK